MAQAQHDPTIPPQELERILRITNVRPEYRQIAAQQIDKAAAACSHRGTWRRAPIQKKPTRLLSRMATLSFSLREAIDRLHSSSDMSFVVFFSHNAVKIVGDDENEFDLYELRDRLDALAKFCCAFTRPRRKRSPHRPRNTVKNPGLLALICSLQIAIEWMGKGKLSLSQNKSSRDAQGPLVEVLNILRCFLPDCVPAKLPYKTLVRALYTARYRENSPSLPRHR